MPTRAAWNVLRAPQLALRLEVALRPGCVYGGARLVANSLSTYWFEVTIWGGAIGTGRTDGKRVSVMPSFAGAVTLSGESRAPAKAEEPTESDGREHGLQG